MFPITFTRNIAKMNAMILANQYNSQDFKDLEIQVGQSMCNNQRIVKFMVALNYHNKLQDKYTKCDGIAEAMEILARSKDEFVKTYDMYEFV